MYYYSHRRNRDYPNVIIYINIYWRMLRVGVEENLTQYKDFNPWYHTVGKMKRDVNLWYDLLYDGILFLRQKYIFFLLPSTWELKYLTRYKSLDHWHDDIIMVRIYNRTQNVISTQYCNLLSNKGLLLCQNRE